VSVGFTICAVKEPEPLLTAIYKPSGAVTGSAPLFAVESYHYMIGHEVYSGFVNEGSENPTEESPCETNYGLVGVAEAEITRLEEQPILIVAL
jgi:hypothetical protein